MLVTRRQFVVDATLAIVAMRSAPAFVRTLPHRESDDGRLMARPLSTTRDPLPAGTHTLSAFNDRLTVVVVPSSASPDRPAPLLLMLHGATESSVQSLDAMRDAAEQAGVILVAPSSAGTTWDAIRGRFGDDLDDIDRQLTRVFEHCAVDAHRIAIAGFSDGASYAVSLGLINGDLFTHIIAHSAGFIIPGVRHGRPRVFIAHGTRDSILPIDRCGRHIAAELETAGYAVDFATFDGGHMIRPEVVRRSLDWFTGAR